MGSNIDFLYTANKLKTLTNNARGNQIIMEQNHPKIEFPCDYPIKVMGESTADFKQFVVDTISHHAPGLDVSRVTTRNSRNSKYIAVTVMMMATSEAQLKAIFQDLKNSGRVKMVL